MRNDFVELIKALSLVVENQSLHFLMKNFEDGVEVKEVMDVVVSAHISALFNTMKTVAKGLDDTELLVENFISSLEAAIKNIHPIESMERI